MALSDTWDGPNAGYRGARKVSRVRKAAVVPANALLQPSNLFRVLIEHTSDIVTVVAADGTITYQSPSCRRVLGYEPEDLIGTSSFPLIHPDDLQWAMAMFSEHIAREGVTPAARIRLRHRDGSWVWLEAVGNNLLNQPDVAGMVISSRDIGAQVRAEQALQESQRWLEREACVMTAIARVGQQLIACLDTRSVVDRLCRVTTEVLECDVCEIHFVDPARDVFVLAAAFGLSSEEYEAFRPITIPRSLIRFDTTDVWSGHVDELGNEQLRKLGRQFAATGVLVIPLYRGQELIGVQCATFRHREGRFSGPQLQIARAIGQLAAMALENARLVEELQQASRLKSEFVATMSHELRTPLNVIIGYTDLLIEESFGPLSPEQRQVCRRVERSAAELLELINATLDLGRLESGRLPLDLQDVALSELVTSVENETHDRCDKPTVRLSWRVNNDLPAVRTDPVKVKVILKNLIANAIKFTPAGEIVVTIAPQESNVELAVRDTGIGIAPETQSIIFEPFRQLDGSMSRRFGGVGLGLYIVRRLVDVLGGTVTVDSELGRGSTFRVLLPASGPPRAALTPSLGSYRNA